MYDIMYMYELKKKIKDCLFNFNTIFCCGSGTYVCVYTFVFILMILYMNCI